MFRQSAGKPDLPITSGVSPQMPGTVTERYRERNADERFDERDLRIAAP
jgi:hypothetical protein